MKTRLVLLLQLCVLTLFFTSGAIADTAAPTCSVMTGKRLVFSGSGAEFKDVKACLSNANSQPDSVCKNIKATLGSSDNVSYTIAFAGKTIGTGKCLAPTPTPVPTPTPNRTQGPFSCLNAWGASTCLDIVGKTFLPKTDINMILIQLGGICFNQADIQFVACPLKDRLGTCNAGPYPVRYYAPLTVAAAQAQCSKNGGAFTVGQ